MFFLLLVKKLRPPSPFLTTSVFSDKDFLDLPPLMNKMFKNDQKLFKKWSNKSEYFLIGIF